MHVFVLRNVNISAEIEKPSVNNMVIENENGHTIDNDSIACSSNSNKETEIIEKMSDVVGRKPEIVKNETETTIESNKTYKIVCLFNISNI